MDLSNFGKKLKVKKHTKSSKVLTELDLFIDVVGRLEKCWDKSNKLYEVFNINILEYEEDYFQIIEDLLLMKYGEWKTEIILWYSFGRKDADGNVFSLTAQLEGEEKTEVTLTTPVELWKFLEKLEKHRPNSEDEK
jgi:hypothetical protein